MTAATVVAEVWDIQRFSSPARLCSWAGLTPGERTSDAHTRRGHITKQGSRWLRWMLVEAATTAVRDPQLGRFTAQIAQRRGPKIARVALARRLLTLCYYALRDDGGCRAYPAPTRWPAACKGRAGPSAAHPVLLRPTRPGGLPCLPRPLEIVAGGLVRARSVCVMALLCNGRRFD